MSESSTGFTVVPQGQWSDAGKVKNCQMESCRKSFGMMSKGTNCYGCGRVCCTSCVATSLVIPGQVTSPPRPVCAYCAAAITQVWEDQEHSLMRCQVLQHILKEQTEQLEELTAKSATLREENEALLSGKRKLEVDLQLCRAEVATLQSEAQQASPPQQPLQRASSVCFSTSSSPAKAASDASPDPLAKRKTLLDIREASLNEAKKKISQDSAKLAADREKLNEEERWMSEELQTKAQQILYDELLDIKQQQLKHIEDDSAAFRQATTDAIAALEAAHRDTTGKTLEAERAKHADEVRGLQESLAAVQASSKDSAAAISELQEKHGKTLEAERAKHADEVRGLRKTTPADGLVEGLQQQLAESTKLCNSHACRVGELETAVAKLKSESVELKKRIQQSSGASAPLRDRIFVLEAEVKKLSSEKVDAAAEVKLLHQKLAKAERQRSVSTAGSPGTSGKLLNPARRGVSELPEACGVVVDGLAWLHATADVFVAGVFGSTTAFFGALEAEARRRRELSTKHANVLAKAADGIKSVQAELKRRSADLDAREAVVDANVAAAQEKWEEVSVTKHRLMLLSKHLQQVANQLQLKEKAVTARQTLGAAAKEAIAAPALALTDDLGVPVGDAAESSPDARAPAVGEGGDGQEAPTPTPDRRATEQQEW